MADDFFGASIVGQYTGDLFSGQSSTTTSGGLGSSALQDWMGLGAQFAGGMVSGSGDSSSAAGGVAEMNTSGWVVGDGTAEGGSLTSSIGGVPWYAWVALGIAAIVVIRKGRK